MSDKEAALKSWIEGVISSGAKVANDNDLNQGEINNLFRELADRYPKQAFTANEEAASAIGEELRQMNLQGTIGSQPEKYKALSEKLVALTSHLEK